MHDEVVRSTHGVNCGGQPGEPDARQCPHQWWICRTLLLPGPSYAGALTIAAITDPDHGPDLDDLMQRLGLERSN
jgi:hypothetical protein